MIEHDFKRYRWAAYARVSTRKQDESCERQFLDIDTWAARVGVDIEEKYADQVSGRTPFLSRPASKQLIECVDSGRITAIAVSSLSRIGRSPVDLVNMLAHLTGEFLGDLGGIDERKSVVKIFDVDSNRMLDLANFDDFTLVWMKIYSFAAEMHMARQRTLSTNNRRRASGGDVGRPPVAYMWSENESPARHVIDTGWKHLIHEILRMRENGAGINKISAAVDKMSAREGFMDHTGRVIRVTNAKVAKIVHEDNIDRYAEDFGYGL